MMLRPNRRRARELKSAMDDVNADLEAAEATEQWEQVEGLKESLNQLRHEFFLTGVESEYDL